MSKQGISQQPDLFEELPTEAKTTLPPNILSLALSQIQTLLIEATAIVEPGREVADEQDHA
jgi:hypothetical protein